MSVADYSTVPSANTTIGGVFIGEGCSPANINNVIRIMAADIRVFYDGVPAAASFMPRAGAAFTGNPTFNGRGGYLHHNDAANTGGRIFIQASGGAVPTMADGDFLAET